MRKNVWDEIQAPDAPGESADVMFEGQDGRTPKTRLRLAAEETDPTRHDMGFDPQLFPIWIVRISRFVLRVLRLRPDIHSRTRKTIRIAAVSSDLFRDLLVLFAIGGRGVSLVCSTVENLTSASLREFMEDPPKLDYATPQKDEPPPITTADRVIGFFGFVVYGLLTLLFGFASITAISQIVGRGRFDNFPAFVIVFLIAAFCGWRAVAAFRQFLRLAKS